MFFLSLRAENITKEYRTGLFLGQQRRVLSEVSLEIRPGETFGLMGPSGAGKSTLGRVIAGLEAPTSGKVLSGEIEISCMGREAYRTFRRKVQVMFQDPTGALNPRKTVSESVRDVLSLLRTPVHQIHSEMKNMLETVGLSEEQLMRYPSQLSGGENQRLALGRILLLKPSYIILDEPTSALDVSVQAQILHLLKDLQASEDIGYLFISHDESVVRYMSDNVGEILDGRLVTEDDSS